MLGPLFWTQINDGLMWWVHYLRLVLWCHSHGKYHFPAITGFPQVLPSHQNISGRMIVIGHYFHSYFLSIFDPTSLHIPYSLFSLMLTLVMFFLFYAFTLTNGRQERNLIGTTRHRTIRLLGYQHSETVLLWFLTRILRWNLLCRHRTLPPLKVLDFLDTEHK